MPPHHHCNAHAGLPRVWLGWGELGNRKSQLQTEQDKYSKTNIPDFELRHPDNRKRAWHVHLDVVRKSTRWIDWRIHKTGNKHKLVLPDLVRLEQIDSLLNFFYTGDYSVDEADLSHYSVRACPGGCVTCPQICQLLRIHLSMFQTALLLRITDLQAIAFRRFRDLMDTAPSFVLQYAVHAVYSRKPIPDGSNNFQITGLKSVLDYRPELVLPAVLRYCGYYRMNPQQITRHGKKVRVFGEAEFAELRKKSPKFSGDLALGIWLDTIDITVPTIQFPGSEPIRSMHPYMQVSLPPQAVDRKRSNYQYVTYLQPLPFEDFVAQKPYNTPTWMSSPGTSFTGSLITPQTSSQRTQTRASFNQGSQVSVQQTPDFPQLDLEQTEDFSFLENALVDPTMDQTNAQLPQECSRGPANLNNLDWIHTMDWSGVDIPDIDLRMLLNDNTMGEPAANASDLTQTVNWAEEDLANVDFTQFLNDDTLNLEDLANVDFLPGLNHNTGEMAFVEPSSLDLPMDMNMDIDLSELNTIDLTTLPDLTSFDLPEMNLLDMAGLPHIDASGLSWDDCIDGGFLNQSQQLDPFLSFGMDSHVNVPQENTFLPEPLNPHPIGTYYTPSKPQSPHPIRTAALPALTPAEEKAIRSAVSAKRKSRASTSRPRQDSTQTRYNLRSRPSVINLTKTL